MSNKSKKFALLISAAALSAALAGSALAGQNDEGFSALRGIQAQPLSVQEMQAISGELNATGIAAALSAAADKLASYTRVAAALDKLATAVTKNASPIDAALMRLHVYTKP